VYSAKAGTGFAIGIREPIKLHWPPSAVTSLTPFESRFLPQAGIVMRPEIERLVEEIKQSAGLLRRHL
jgi:hypothetical protein